MSGKEISSGDEVPAEPAQQLLLSASVKIDEHIPAEDDRDRFPDAKIFVHEVELLEFHQRPYFRGDLDQGFSLVSAFEKVFLPQQHGNGFNPSMVIDPPGRLFQDPGADVGGEN